MLIPDDEVHVWHITLEGAVDEFVTLLPPDETAWAARFRFAHHRAHFIRAHGALRAILSRYLGQAPLEIRFECNPHGKPYLAGGSAIRFNLSHSHGLALVGVARGREVGVDVEQFRPGVLEHGIAERFFSPREVAALRALPAGEQPAAFFRCWTRKEAYIKAKGRGLAIRLSDFDVSLAPGGAACLLRSLGEPDDEPAWSMWDIDPGPGYAGCAMAQGRNCRIREFFF